MKRLIILTFLATFAAIVSAATAPQRIYILPIDDEIGSSTWRYVRSGLAEAREEKADMVIVHLNTYGGAVDSADSIRTALMRFPAPVVALVDNNAASAGALIALACDSVYMVKGSSMGAATVVNGADGTAMPDKYQSYMRAMMRATAERHGKVAVAEGDSTTLRWRRDPLIAESMVDSRVVVPGLIDSTRVLTFTAEEAIKWGYAEGYATGIPDLMSQMGVADNAEIKNFEPTWVDHLMGFLSNPAFKAILISLILLGIYWELQIPGAGFPIVTSIVAAILYFLPICIDGASFSPWITVLFAAGVILIVLEIFVVPGFGVTGIAGIVCVAASLIWGLAGNIALDTPADGSGGESVRSMAGALAEAFLWFIGALAVTIGVSAWLTSRRGPKSVTRHTELAASQPVEEGFIGVDMSIAGHVGEEAVATTPLRPSGKIAIGDTEFDAVAEHGFIETGERVRVTRHSGAQLYVRACKQPAEGTKSGE